MPWRPWGLSFNCGSSRTAPPSCLGMRSLFLGALVRHILRLLAVTRVEKRHLRLARPHPSLRIWCPNIDPLDHRPLYFVCAVGIVKSLAHVAPCLCFWGHEHAEMRRGMTSSMSERVASCQFMPTDLEVDARSRQQLPGEPPMGPDATERKVRSLRRQPGRRD